jgi:murein DD-endopeptidase MepM/ murein hydrolase activator NlpD
MTAKKKINILLIFLYTSALALILISLLKSDNKETLPTKIEKKPEIVLNQFGFADDSLIVQQANVKPDQTLSGIFAQYNLREDVMTKLLSISAGRFDYHKIIAGNSYHAFMKKDSINTLSYLVYEEDPINYVVFDFEDSLKIYTGKKPVETKRKKIAATINHSLYTAMLKNEASPELVLELSEVFAWQLDFYRVQKGDYFKVIYDEEFVNGQSIGIKKIIGAYFNHEGEDFYAVEFEQDNTSQYFDENGKSLRKAFLKAPLRYSRISSRYSLRRLHPVQKVYKAHLGTDYAAPTGTPIRTVGDGIVTETSYSQYNGRYVKIRHNSVYSTQYLHMSRYAKGIKPGVKVTQGQVIGYVGSTGLATGPHLCYRFWKNGKQVNPLRVKIPPSHPVKRELLENYNKRKIEVITELDSIKLPFENNPQVSSIVK